jgi:hypothetical protein
MNTTKTKVETAAKPSETNFTAETHGISLPPLQNGKQWAIFYGKEAPSTLPKNPEPPKDPVKQ